MGRVDCNLELAHIAKLNEEKANTALLFSRIKDHPNARVLTSLFSHPSRVALSLGLDKECGIVGIARHLKGSDWKEVEPQEASAGPILQNEMKDKKVNLLEFPVPKLFPRDGGRYFGTAAYLITKDPETSRVNVGVYRMQLLDNHSLGLMIVKGKDADIMLGKHRHVGKPMPAVACMGGDPLLFLFGGMPLPYGVSELRTVCGIRGGKLDVVRSDLTGLPIPADAEIAAEGFIDPDPKSYRKEGPFGEYTGYYTEGEELRPWLDVKRILHRNDPIFCMATVGRPIGDNHVLNSVSRTTAIWHGLDATGIPGIQSVYAPPEAGGRFGCIVSVEQMYPGHSRHAAMGVLATVPGNYGVKWVIVVDSDIDADDLRKVLWAASARFNPEEGMDVIRRGRSTPLDPALPADSKYLTSRVVIDATIPFERKDKPIAVDLDERLVKRIKKRKRELGLDL